MMVGRLLSFWGPAYFQGRTVKLPGGYRCHYQSSSDPVSASNMSSSCSPRREAHWIKGFFSMPNLSQKHWNWDEMNTSWFQPIWNICSSKWESSPNKGENQKYSKPATRTYSWSLTSEKLAPLIWKNPLLVKNNDSHILTYSSAAKPHNRIYPQYHQMLWFVKFPEAGPSLFKNKFPSSLGSKNAPWS